MNNLIKNLMRRKPQTLTMTLEEVHTYTEDLQRITMLRDKSSGKERDEYSTEIECMQVVLQHLNEVLRKSLQAQAR